MGNLQHGFREQRSCETQLIMLVEDLARNAGSGKQTDLILLDFSKAFDKVNHSKLILKLQNYGIRSTVLNWIGAFLGDRAQKVVVGARNRIRSLLHQEYRRGLSWDRSCSLSTSMTYRIKLLPRYVSLPMTLQCI